MLLKFRLEWRDGTGRDGKAAIYLVLPAGAEKLKPTDGQNERTYYISAFGVLLAFAAAAAPLLARESGGIRPSD